MRGTISTILLCGLLTMTAAPVFGNTRGTLVVAPDVLYVDIFFSGGKVTVEGDIPEADDVMIEVMGPKVNEIFNVKGRIGPFWMTREKVHIDNAPELYMLLLPKGTQWSKQAVALGLGVDQLKNFIHVNGSERSMDDLFQMFVRLKGSEQLYGEIADAISYSPGENNRRHFSAVYRFPPSTATGAYTIKATTISNGVRDSEFIHDMTVEEAGFVKLVNKMASDQRWAYGIAAVVIALFAGAVMGVLFKGSRGH